MEGVAMQGFVRSSSRVEQLCPALLLALYAPISVAELCL